MSRGCEKLSLPLHHLFYSMPDFFPSPKKPFKLPMYAEPLARAFAAQHITNYVFQTISRSLGP
jgi:hypothetical protein